MKEIEFKTRTLSIVSSYTRMNFDYREPFPELCIFFDKEDTDISCSYIGTPSVVSELNMIRSIFEILEYRNTSEMVGCKLSELRYRTKNILNEWTPWECAGFGSLDSDKFIEQCGDGTIMTQSELEESFKDTECN